MNTSPPPSTTPKTTADWLKECGFETRPTSTAPGILTHKIDRSATSSEDPALNGFFPLTGAPAAGASPEVATEKKPVVDQKQMASEVHSFSHLAAGVCASENGRDSLPEYIIFGIVALLATAWPIWAMLRTWLSHH